MPEWEEERANEQHLETFNSNSVTPTTSHCTGIGPPEIKIGKNENANERKYSILKKKTKKKQNRLIKTNIKLNHITFFHLIQEFLFYFSFSSFILFTPGWNHYLIQTKSDLGLSRLDFHIFVDRWWLGSRRFQHGGRWMGDMRGNESMTDTKSNIIHNLNRNLILTESIYNQ